MAEPDRATGKFVAFYELIEACRQPGCPVCRRLTEGGRRHLDAMLYEQVTDPDTRRRLRASWGFCNWHAWMLLEIPGAVSGAAIIYEDLTRVAIERIGRLRRAAPARAGWLARLRRLGRPAAWSAAARRRHGRAACPVCLQCREAEERYAAAILEFVDDRELVRAYEVSHGLCAPHLLQVLERGAPTPGLDALVGRTLAKWAALRRDLGGFVAKHEYRNRQPFTEAEAASCARAVEMLAGGRAVWGNALHGARDGGSGAPGEITAASGAA
ncbi:MAG: hypothetical protein HY217_10225 [Candidatus Rokubacteria bacterium]|nr:hypothetical protein [Candidatus Rokubacteria bacterium]